MMFFKRPHPFIFDRSSVLLPGLLTFLLIAIIAPFEFQKLPLEMRLFFALIVGGICSFSVWLTVTFLRKFFPVYMDVETWTTGKEITLFISATIVVCISIFLFLYVISPARRSPFMLLGSVAINTLAIGIFPIFIIVLYEQYNHQKKQLAKAMQLNRMLHFKSKISSEMIQLTGENGKTELQLMPEEIIFLKSDGNYVDVHYRLKHPEKKLIRNRLKFLIEQLPKRQFFQCHKSYVVNKEYILSVVGNARNFELKLRDISDPIPVSRGKSEALKQFLEA